MKKVKLSLAALTLVLAIAGTTTANATKSPAVPVPLCSQVSSDQCPDVYPIECCEDDATGQPVFSRSPIQ
jgi:hypothetical protein